MYAWDVVNEFAKDVIGQDKRTAWDDIDNVLHKVFEWAHEADKDALLFYNDYGFASDHGWEKFKSGEIRELILDLVSNGTPIQGVGMQMHIDVDFSDDMLEGVRDNVRKYAEAGLFVHFTEIDIKCKGSSDDFTKCDHEWNMDDEAKQAKLYGELLKICLDATNCQVFSTWGITDKYAKLHDMANGLLFDDQLKPKGAYHRLLDVLQSE